MIHTHPYTPGGDWKPNRCRFLSSPNSEPCGLDLSQHARMLVSVPVGRFVFPPTDDVYTQATRLDGVTVAVQRDARLVLRVMAFGDFDLGPLDGFVADLELARAHRRRYEQHPEHYAPGGDTAPPAEPCCEFHEPDGVEEIQCCDDCPTSLAEIQANPRGDDLAYHEQVQARRRGHNPGIRAETITPVDGVL